MSIAEVGMLKKAVAARDRINDSNTIVIDAFIKNEGEYIEEIKQLKEALKKCSPFIAVTGARLEVCEFCFDNPHTEDCKYIKLIGGDGE